MRICSSLALAIGLLLPLAALAQAEPPGAISVPLAAGRLDSVVSMPMYLRLYIARLPAAAHAVYEGPSAMLYDVSGTASVEVKDDAAHPLAAGAGVFIAPGRPVTIHASPSETTDLLLFVLTARPNQRRVLERPAVTRELFRTPEPLPGLQSGPYEFSLTQLTLPPGTAAGPAYARSGAALDFVLAGTAETTADGESETTPALTPLFERFGWFHQLANPGAAPLVLLQANLSQEGVPAVSQAAGK